MDLPLLMRTSAESWTGSLCVSLNDWRAFQPGETSLAKKVMYVAVRTFAALAVLLTNTVDFVLFCSSARYGTTKLGQDLTNLFASLFIPLFVLRMPFGYLPKVDYLRQSSVNDSPQLPVRHDAARQNEWDHILESDSKIVEMISKFDDYATIEDLKTAIHLRLSQLGPEKAQIFQNLGIPFEGALLQIAAQHNLHSLLKRLIQKGAPVDTLAPARDGRTLEPLLAHAVKDQKKGMVKFLISKGANVQATFQDNFDLLDYNLLNDKTMGEYATGTCFFRICRWYSNVVTKNIAKQLIDQGAQFDASKYRTLNTEVNRVCNLTGVARNTALANNTASLNLYIRRYASNRNPHFPPFASKVQTYFKNVHDRILPEIEQYYQQRARQALANS